MRYIDKRNLREKDRESLLERESEIERQTDEKRTFETDGQKDNEDYKNSFIKYALKEGKKIALYHNYL